MHDAQIVRLGDGLGRLEDEVDGLADGQRALSSEPLAKIDPVEQLHDDVVRAGVERPHVENAGYVLAPDLGRDLGLPGEACNGLRVPLNLVR